MHASHSLSLRQRAIRRFWVTVNQLTPRNPAGDRLISWLLFLRRQHRLPRRDRLWFNDVLYRIKTSPEINDPLRVFTSDKEFVKLYVRAMLGGDEHNVPTLAVLRSPRECLAHAFPERCVIKPTHLSGTVILRRRGEPIDYAKMQGWFTRNIYPGTRESNYRTLTPKVIVEPFVFDDDNPSDYKIFCFNGEPRLIQVDRDRQSDHKRDFYDTAWRRQPFALLYPTGKDAGAERPASLETMLDIARRLSSGMGFVRVDLYSNGQLVCVGELTHCHGNAEERFSPPSSEAAASALIFGTGVAPSAASVSTAEAAG